MKLVPYFVFDGNCKQAIDLYTEVFGATNIQVMKMGDAGQTQDMQLPEGAENLIMHACIEVAGTNIMFSDNFPGSPYTGGGDTISIAINDVSIEEAHRIYDQLKVNGVEKLPISKTFWSGAYGMVVDQFGITWQISAIEEK